jgi:signal peptide peptidase SppA
MLLPHLASRLYGTPLLVARSKLDIILAVLGARIGWPEPKPDFSALPSPRTQPQAAPSPSNLLGTGIAVIPVHGTLVRRSLGLDAASGLMSYGDIATMLDVALTDPGVTGILLDIDSPGGEAGGVFELGERIRAADAIKPVWAIASDSAFSAAYAIACAASRITVTRTGGVGSIGVIAMHVDQTVRDAQEGYRYTAITAGAQKNDFSPHEMLTSEAHARLQAEVDRLYGLFVDHVAQMRGINANAVRATEAGLYFGAQAIASGLADAQGSFDSVFAEFATFLATRGGTNTLRFAGSALPRTQSLSVQTQSHTPTHFFKESSAMQQTHELPPLSDETMPDKEQHDTAAQEEAVQLAVVASIAATRADAVAIAELCQLSGHPERTAAFLAEGASESQVRRALLAARANSVEITSAIAPDGAANRQTIAAANPLLAAVKKITGKE